MKTSSTSSARTATTSLQSAGTSQTGGFAYNTNNFYAFPPGTRFKALILDIQPGKITIKLSDETSFTAKTRVLPDARIGEESYFLVKVNNLDGLIQLEMLRSSPQHSQDKLVKEVLQTAGITAADQNMDIGRAILAQNMPLDEPTLQKTLYFQNQTSHTPSAANINNNNPENPENYALQKALFLVQAGFPENAASVKTLNAILEPTQHLTALLQNSQNAGAELGAELLDLAKISQANNLQTPQLQQFYKNLITNPKTPVQILQNLAFMASLEQQPKQVSYYQIPFTFKKQPGHGELFVYKNPQKTPQNGSQTAVIAADTQNIGRIEVLANQNNRNLTLNFSCANEAVEKLVKAKISQLNAVLAKTGLSVTNVTYQQTARTTVLTQPPNSTAANNAENFSNKRYTFDMRV
ncbi:MAG: flagellar hook-length control protein FliK [Defluviitaleaceae bacterium]|nr:flagellar hook-length control protein FliK [Defluviitaleaceae bacterium]